MGIIDKIFGRGGDKSDKAKKSLHDQRSKYMPEEKLPVDERFTFNFQMNGGRFIYCIDANEVQTNFDNILLENDWYEKDVCCFNKTLIDKFEGFNLNYSDNTEAAFFLTTCEYLIGNNGSILISSRQIKEKKIQEFPDFMVVFASTSQLVEGIGEGLRGIKNKKDDCIPSNITTIKNFKSKDDKDFLTYGSSIKTVYLLLIEDL